jgi:leucyl aminopeptidase
MLKLITTDPARMPAEMVAVPVFEDTDPAYEKPLVELIARVRALAEFSGKVKDNVTLYDPVGLAAQRVLFIGLGQMAAVDRQILRSAAGRAVRQAVNAGLTRLAVRIPLHADLPLDAPDAVTAVMEGAGLANYRFNRYKSNQPRTPLRRIEVPVSAAMAKTCRAAAFRTNAVCEAVHQARDWVNIPSIDKTPVDFAKAVLAAAEKRLLKTRLLDKAALRRGKFGAILAVAAGSRNPPALAVLDYRPSRPKSTVVLVGKGVTFDSGGLNLKTTRTINMMKVDMAGAAAVAATLLAATRLKPSHRVVGILPLVENMVSGTAVRPGDVIRTYSGKTVEIGNTDAEGRLILSDAIAYAVQTYRPDVLIDAATLTGACITALGEEIAGLFSNDDALAETILQSSRATHERCWRMPLPDDYRELLSSDVADINNMPKSRAGGAISAALFLSEFVGTARWAHIDIAGPAYRKKADAICEAGGTGFGVQLFCDLLEKELRSD